MFMGMIIISFGGKLESLWGGMGLRWMCLGKFRRRRRLSCMLNLAKDLHLFD